mmetsp:Transcript_37186/g.60672  ORF Transcript_37186/g.60672 Transcript_37186/m.60672 type:complete len:890 (+) Transcript_37186:59-2728(+)
MRNSLDEIHLWDSFLLMDITLSPDFLLSAWMGYLVVALVLSLLLDILFHTIFCTFFLCIHPTKKGWQCHLQMRFLHSDIKCPVCKASNETLIVDTDNLTVEVADANDGAIVHHKQFDQYQLWGNDLGGGFVFREDVGMHFPNKLYEEYVVPLLGYGCGLPNCEFTNVSDSYINEKDMKETGAIDNKKKQPPAGQCQRVVKKRLTGLKALKTHLRIDHGYAICDLCVTNKRDFVSKISRYTPSGLKQHQSRGDGDQSGFSGHPLCEFCKPLRFYDIVALHEHLNKEHYKCHICEKLGMPNQFFKDYARLERHFDQQHYLCHDPQCLAARFMVYENEIDLRGHENSVHGTNGGTKIKLEFRVRREGELFQQQNVPTGDDFQYGLNGEAFVPEALPEQQRHIQEQVRQVNEQEISHPLHAARTAELRVQAAMMRETGVAAGGVGGRSEAFPALEAAAASESSSGMLVGWTADGARTAGGSSSHRGLRKTPIGKVTKEEFPSLGPGPGFSSAALRKIGVGSRPMPKRNGPNFSSVARPTLSSTPMSAGAYASSYIPVKSAPDMTGNNFPSLGGGGPKSYVQSIPTASSSRAAAAPNLSTNNFPSLGGMSSSRPKSSSGINPYAATQAHARKLNAGRAPGSAPPAAYPTFSSSSDFPPPPTTKKSNPVKSAFAPKKPPPMMDNVMQFPPPSLSSTSQSLTSSLSTKGPTKPSAQSLQAGKETLETLKQILGTIGYKKLKSLTKDFAMDSIVPEAYVDEAASLFDQGLSDTAFWHHIPPLINDIPNKSAVDRAMRHLESVRMVNEMQEMEFNVGGGGGARRKKPINYVLPAKKNANSWGNTGKSSFANQPSPAAAASTAKKKEFKKGNVNIDNGNGKKSKSKKKNNELKSLAFGA